MPEALSFTDIDRQHLELLPARTVMSMLTAGTGTAGDANSSSTTTTTTSGTSSPTGGAGDLLKDNPVFAFLGSFAGKVIPLK